MSNQSLREAAQQALDEIECDMFYLFGRASSEGHESGQRLAKAVREKMRAARAALAQPDDKAQAVATQRDRLLSALERAAKAESMLRSLVDECGNDSVEGWEDRMRELIERANIFLSSAPQPPAEQGAELSDNVIFACGKAAGRQEVKDAQQSPEFKQWITRAYREPETTNFTIHNMEVAYQAGRESFVAASAAVAGASEAQITLAADRAARGGAA